jgi:hypothetical protein
MGCAVGPNLDFGIAPAIAACRVGGLVPIVPRSSGSEWKTQRLKFRIRAIHARPDSSIEYFLIIVLELAITVSDTDLFVFARLANDSVNPLTCICIRRCGYRCTWPDRRADSRRT